MPLDASVVTTGPPPRDRDDRLEAHDHHSMVEDPVRTVSQLLRTLSLEQPDPAAVVGEPPVPAVDDIRILARRVLMVGEMLANALSQFSVAGQAVPALGTPEGMHALSSPQPGSDLTRQQQQIHPLLAMQYSGLSGVGGIPRSQLAPGGYPTYYPRGMQRYTQQIQPQQNIPWVPTAAPYQGSAAGINFSSALPHFPQQQQMYQLPQQLFPLLSAPSTGLLNRVPNQPLSGSYGAMSGPTLSGYTYANVNPLPQPAWQPATMMGTQPVAATYQTLAQTTTGAPQSPGQPQQPQQQPNLAGTTAGNAQQLGGGGAPLGIGNPFSLGSLVLPAPQPPNGQVNVGRVDQQATSPASTLSNPQPSLQHLGDRSQPPFQVGTPQGLPRGGMPSGNGNEVAPMNGMQNSAMARMQQQQQRQLTPSTSTMFKVAFHRPTAAETQVAIDLVRNMQAMLQSKVFAAKTPPDAAVQHEYTQALERATRLATETEGKLPIYAVFLKDDIIRQLVLWCHMARTQRTLLSGSLPPKYIITLEELHVLVRRLAVVGEVLKSVMTQLSVASQAQFAMAAPNQTPGQPSRPPAGALMQQIPQLAQGPSRTPVPSTHSAMPGAAPTPSLAPRKLLSAKPDMPASPPPTGAIAEDDARTALQPGLGPNEGLDLGSPHQDSVENDLRSLAGLMGITDPEQVEEMAGMAQRPVSELVERLRPQLAKVFGLQQSEEARGELVGGAVPPAPSATMGATVLDGAIPLPAQDTPGTSGAVQVKTERGDAAANMEPEEISRTLVDSGEDINPGALDVLFPKVDEDMDVDGAAGFSDSIDIPSIPSEENSWEAPESFDLKLQEAM